MFSSRLRPVVPRHLTAIVPGAEKLQLYDHLLTTSYLFGKLAAVTWDAFGRKEVMALAGNGL
jgi:hypothetical protein